MEAKLAKQGTTYFAGPDLNIGDIQVYCQFLDLAYYGWDWSGWPTLSKWAETCRKAPGLKEVHDQFFSGVINDGLIRTIDYPQNV